MGCLNVGIIKIFIKQYAYQINMYLEDISKQLNETLDAIDQGNAFELLVLGEEGSGMEGSGLQQSSIDEIPILTTQQESSDMIDSSSRASDIYELEVATRLNGNMITWHDDLADPSSEMYKTLKDQLEPEITSILES